MGVTEISAYYSLTLHHGSIYSSRLKLILKLQLTSSVAS